MCLCPPSSGSLTRQVENRVKIKWGAAVLKKCLINQCSHRVMGLSPRDLAHHPLYPFHVLIPFSLGVSPILCFFTWPVLFKWVTRHPGKKKETVIKQEANTSGSKKKCPLAAVMVH